MYGGELLKLIDVAAGVVAAKHAGGPCLTISVECVSLPHPVACSRRHVLIASFPLCSRVIFLQGSFEVASEDLG